MADRLARELDRWPQRTPFDEEDDLVLAHPETGNPLGGSKVSKRFKAACREAGVREVRFQDLRHTFATRLAASGRPLRTIQEFLGHGRQDDPDLRALRPLGAGSRDGQQRVLG